MDGGLARCAGEAGPVGMSWCSLSSAVTLDSRPSHINQICRSSHMSKQRDKPPAAIPGTHRTHCQHCVCISHETFLQRSVETSKKFNWHQYYMYFCVFLIFLKVLWVNKKKSMAEEKGIRGNPEGGGSHFWAKWSFGKTWGYVRHCNRRTGTMDLHLKKKLIPVSICHLMLNSTLYISYSHIRFHIL